MIKVISAANQHPTHRSREDFFKYWRQRHGPLFSKLSEDGPTLFTYPMSVVIAREGVIKG